MFPTILETPHIHYYRPIDFKILYEDFISLERENRKYGKDFVKRGGGTYKFVRKFKNLKFVVND